MSGRKNAIEVFPLFTNAVMTGTTVLTSPITTVKFLDNVSIDVSWTGTPTGEFKVQECLDYDVNAPSRATWRDLAFATTILAAGAAGDHQMFLNQVPFYALRVTYTNASGTGTLNGKISAKMV